MPETADCQVLLPCLCGVIGAIEKLGELRQLPVEGKRRRRELPCRGVRLMEKVGR